MAIRPSAIFYLPNTTTVLARSAINSLRAASQPLLDEAITTLHNRSLPGPAVMAHLEQNVNFAEVLEKMANEWTPETVRSFGAAFTMDPAKTDVMDIIVAIAILNEADLEAELRGENTPEATPTDLLENRRITWQHPPPGTLLNPPYIVLVAVEQIDTRRADSEVQAILGELVDYKGYRIPKRMSIPLKPLPGLRPGAPEIRIRPELSAVRAGADLTAGAAASTPAVEAVVPAPAAPAVKGPVAGILNRTPLEMAISKNAGRFIRGL